MTHSGIDPETCTPTLDVQVYDRSHEPAAVFDAWLAEVEARPAAWETAETVERVARAIHQEQNRGAHWDLTFERVRDEYRRLARAALAAVHDRDGQR